MNGVNVRWVVWLGLFFVTGHAQTGEQAHVTLRVVNARDEVAKGSPSMPPQI